MDNIQSRRIADDHLHIEISGSGFYNNAISFQVPAASGSVGFASPSVRPSMSPFIQKMVNVALQAEGNIWSLKITDFDQCVLTFIGPANTSPSTVYFSMEKLLEDLKGCWLVFKIGHMSFSVNGEAGFLEIMHKEGDSIPENFKDQPTMYKNIEVGLSEVTS